MIYGCIYNMDSIPLGNMLNIFSIEENHVGIAQCHRNGKIGDGLLDITIAVQYSKLVKRN